MAAPCSGHTVDVLCCAACVLCVAGGEYGQIRGRRSYLTACSKSLILLTFSEVYFFLNSFICVIIVNYMNLCPLHDISAFYTYDSVCMHAIRLAVCSLSSWYESADSKA